MAQIFFQCMDVLKIPHWVHLRLVWQDNSPQLVARKPTLFKVFVGNHLAQVMELILLDCWKHFNSDDNPGDSTSHGIYMYPSQRLTYTLSCGMDPSGWSLIRSNGPDYRESSQFFLQEKQTTCVQLPVSHLCSAHPWYHSIVFQFSSVLFKLLPGWINSLLTVSQEYNAQMYNNQLFVQKMNRDTHYWIKVI